MFVCVSVMTKKNVLYTNTPVSYDPHFIRDATHIIIQRRDWMKTVERHGIGSEGHGRRHIAARRGPLRSFLIVFILNACLLP